jgi:hypothetical protein
METPGQVGRYYVEIRAEHRSQTRTDYQDADYTLRLSEYTPYCPNNCTGQFGHGRCDCTILRCICNPGFFGDDCAIAPHHAEVPASEFPITIVTCDMPRGSVVTAGSLVDASHGGVGGDASCDCCGPGATLSTQRVPFNVTSVVLDRHGGGQRPGTVFPDQPGRGTLYNLTCPNAICSDGRTLGVTKDNCELTGFKWINVVDAVTGGPKGQKCVVGTMASAAAVEETKLAENGGTIPVIPGRADKVSCEETGFAYTAVDFVLVGINGSYYEHHNPRLFERTSVTLVRRVELVCAMLLPQGIISRRSNETVLVTNNHSLSIYARTLSRYSYRQEYLSPEQLDLDCVTPGGKAHLDECRLLHGIWSAQQTMYAEEAGRYTHTCGPDELMVGQTVDVLAVNQTCEDDGFGCTPRFPICRYVMFNSSAERCVSLDGVVDVAQCEGANLQGGGLASEAACLAAGACAYSAGEVLNLTVPCHELCEVPHYRANASLASCDVEDLSGVDPATLQPGEKDSFQATCAAVDISMDEYTASTECNSKTMDANYVDAAGNAVSRSFRCVFTAAVDWDNTTAHGGGWASNPRHAHAPRHGMGAHVPTQYVLCNGTNFTSPWALENYDRHWPGNDWDWRSQKYFGGAITNEYFGTFEADGRHVEGEAINLPRDFISGRADYHRPFSYRAPLRLHANDGAYGNEYWAWQGRRRRAQAAASVEGGAAVGHRVARGAHSWRLAHRLQEIAMDDHEASMAHRRRRRRLQQPGQGAPGAAGGPGSGGPVLGPHQQLVGANCSAPACATAGACTTAERCAHTPLPLLLRSCLVFLSRVSRLLGWLEFCAWVACAPPAPCPVVQGGAGRGGCGSLTRSASAPGLAEIYLRWRPARAQAQAADLRGGGHGQPDGAGGV